LLTNESRRDLAGHQRDLRAHAQAAERSGRRHAAAKFFDWVYSNGGQDGRGARLRSDAAAVAGAVRKLWHRRSRTPAARRLRRVTLTDAASVDIRWARAQCGTGVLPARGAGTI
jgi:hypothetical protein